MGSKFLQTKFRCDFISKDKNLMNEKYDIGILPLSFRKKPDSLVLTLLRNSAIKQ